MSYQHPSLATRSDLQVGYCTNVHAGIDLESIRANLSTYAFRVRDQLASDGGGDRLGVGLWIPDQASRELAGGGTEDFAAFLDANRLNAFTINGFPYANFHGDHVKQRVYLPAWDQAERLEYTERLATILAAILPADQRVGSISTLPIGWPNNPFAERAGGEVDLEAAGANLRELAKSLKRLRADTGRHIVVAIEPEPGCLIDTVGDMVAFFDRHLPDPDHRSYLGVCHDVCHSAVMNEPQRDVIAAYAEAGIEIGKVQVSSAVVAPWDDIDPEDHGAALSQLGEFAEDRYLHQTGRVGRDGAFDLVDDLPELVRKTSVEDLAGFARWVIHFHVPIFLESFGHLTTSRDAVIECLEALADESIPAAFSGHLEVETYAWTVLPPEMRSRGLAEDIAGEVSWLMRQLAD